MRNNVFFPTAFDKAFTRHPKRYDWNQFVQNPSVNISESDDQFLIELAAPGLSKEDFELKIEKDLLTVSSKKEESSEEKDGKFTRREFNFTSFTRSFHLPEIVDNDAIKASYSEGILKIQLPKNVELIKEKVKTIEIA